MTSAAAPVRPAKVGSDAIKPCAGTSFAHPPHLLGCGFWLLSHSRRSQSTLVARSEHVRLRRVVLPRNLTASGAAQGAPAVELAVACLAVTPDGSAAPTTLKQCIQSINED
jgi:hypothetical protein